MKNFVICGYYGDTGQIFCHYYRGSSLRAAIRWLIAAHDEALELFIVSAFEQKRGNDLNDLNPRTHVEDARTWLTNCDKLELDV